MREFVETLNQMIDQLNLLYEDVALSCLTRFKQERPNRKIIGHLPIYVPREIIHAAGMLPVGIMGGGDKGRFFIYPLCLNCRVFWNPLANASPFSLHHQWVFLKMRRDHVGIKDVPFHRSSWRSPNHVRR